jgi:zinc transport system permease protein
MLDDFLIRALVAGVGVALVAGPLGCIVVWRRLSYFGDTLAHGALLGVGLSLVLSVDLIGAVFATAVVIALAVHALVRGGGLPSDAILGLLSHSALAFGIVVVALFGGGRIDLLGLLFGDILAVSQRDLILIAAAVPAILITLAVIWRPLIAATMSSDIARAEGAASRTAELTLLILVAAVIALAMQIVGVLLISALLIIPASTARGFAGSPETMAPAATLIGDVSVASGLGGSLVLDTPAGPTIVCAAALLFLAGRLAGLIPQRLRREPTSQ